MVENNKPHICTITATCGRHRCLERVVRFLLNQKYDGKHTILIYNNSSTSQKMDENLIIPDNKNILLINQSTNIETGINYTSLGEIYNDCLKFIPEDIGIISFADDDDIFLPNHISAGVAGYEKVKNIDSKYLAYKPARSFYRHANGLDLIGNVLEPSIFVDANHVKIYGFSNTTTEQHWQWLNPLHIEQTLYLDDLGIPTLIYNWGDTNFPTFKTSGDFHNPNNFDNYRNFSQENGDGIITPISIEESEIYYQEVYNWKLNNQDKLNNK